MEPALPPSVRSLVEGYVDALAVLRPRLHGVYVHGGVALGAFEEGPSDIDILALTEGTFAVQELAALGRVHALLCQAHPLGKRLDVDYLPLSDLEKGNGDVGRHPVARNGRFRRSRGGGLNAVTRWMMKHRSIHVLGPQGAALPITVAWRDVVGAMSYNLDTYWAGQAARPHLFLSDYWVTYAVSTLCRILTTLEDGEIIAKSPALACWRDRLPERWRPLVEEAWRIRHDPRAPSRYRSRLGRMRATLAFIAYVRARGNAVLATADPCNLQPRPMGRP